MGGKDDGRNVWEKPLIFDVVAEKWPFLFQIFPSKNRSFDFEKSNFRKKFLYVRARARVRVTATGGTQNGQGRLIKC